MEITSLLSFALVGMAVGLIVGLTGVGGGSLMTPVLTGVFQVPPAVAVGTDLVFAAVTKGVGTAVHGLKKTVQWNAVLWLLAGSLPAALAALAWLHAYGAPDEHLNQLIKRMVGISVLATVVALIFRARAVAWLRAHPRAQISERARVAALIVGGFILGLLVTVSSIGAGALGATFLLLLHPHWEPAEVAGTDIAYAVPLTAVAGAGHFALGTADTALLAGLLIGSVPAIAFGSYIARALPEKLTRSLLAVMLTFAGFKMVL
jgi:uncharacterized membrane protein YfcA